MSVQPHNTSSKEFSGTMFQLDDADSSGRSYALENLEIPVCYLKLDEIRRDGGTQPRVAIDLKHVKLLEAQMEDGQELEPIAIFYDGESHWLADGYHRFSAHRNQERQEIACVIHQGTRRDAVLYSVGANAEHKPALPRSREDKRRAVMTLLSDSEWGQWSDCEIARRCRVSDKTVGNLRRSIFGNSDDTKLNTSRKVQRAGKTYTVNTANIGKTTQSPEHELIAPATPNHVTITDDHPLFSGRVGTIQQLPNPEAAIVEFDTGERELISLNHLKPTIIPQLYLEEGGLVEINAPGNRRIDRRRGRIASVGESTVEVWVRDVDRMIMHNYKLQHQQVTPLPLEEELQLEQVCARLAKLHKCSLDPFEVEILNLLKRPVAFTPIELEYLVAIEQRYKDDLVQ